MNTEISLNAYEFARNFKMYVYKYCIRKMRDLIKRKERVEARLKAYKIKVV